jgi:NitT/TauT family transport system substrate-binding protein
MSKLSRTTRVGLVAGAVALMLATTTIGGLAVAPAQAASGVAEKVRIAYFANITHAPALIARQKQIFEKYLGATKIEYSIFSVGTAEVEAFKGGAIDFGYIGPSPSISGYTTTQGTLLKVVSGAVSGGAKFIVKPELIATEGKPTAAEIKSLKGKTFATPGLAGTQDVALRNFLRKNSIPVGAGDQTAHILPTENATTLTLFQKGSIDGGWVPEPWATRLVQEGKGKVFVDEASLWPGGKYITTDVIASQKFLQQYPATVKALLLANNEALAFLNNPANKQASIDLAQAELKARTGKVLSDAVIGAAWPALTFTADPLASTWKTSFIAGINAKVLGGSLSAADLKGIFDLRILNGLLKAAKQKTVVAAGLGKQ